MKISFLLILIFFSFCFFGCEKEVGDILAPERMNPNEGNYTFRLISDLSGTKNITINNRGNFAFFVSLNESPGGSPYAVTITGSVDLDGNLNGSIYRFQNEVGTLSGVVAYGSFVFDDGIYSVSGTYSMESIQ